MTGSAKRSVYLVSVAVRSSAEMQSTNLVRWLRACSQAARMSTNQVLISRDLLLPPLWHVPCGLPGTRTERASCRHAATQDDPPATGTPGFEERGSAA